MLKLKSINVPRTAEESTMTKVHLKALFTEDSAVRKISGHNGKHSDEFRKFVDGSSNKMAKEGG
jgi:hypothetical protein